MDMRSSSDPGLRSHSEYLSFLSFLLSFLFFFLFLSFLSFSPSPSKASLTLNGKKGREMEDKLWNASSAGDLITLRSILEENPTVDVNWVKHSDRFDTPLHRSCRLRHLEIVRELLRHPRIDLNKGNKGDATPFYIACQEGHADVVAVLLATPGIDGNKPSVSVATPFLIACYNGHTEVVELLLRDARINPRTANQNSASPFYMACQNGHTSIALMLLGDPRTDVNLCSNTEATPFLMACSNGHREIVARLLADPRIDANKPMKGGDPPLFFACQNNSKEIVELLLADSRVDVNKANHHEVTPFFIAAQQGHDDVVFLLLGVPSVDPNKAREDSTTPLWMAAQIGQLSTIQVMLASSREINVTLKSTFNQHTAAQQARLVASIPIEAAKAVENYERTVANCAAVATLLDEYEVDSESVRQRLRKLPDIRHRLIGATFALVVFFTDEYLKPATEILPSFQRFFDLCARLPLDLQMVICNRMFDSARCIVLSRDSEPGFRWLVRANTWG